MGRREVQRLKSLKHRVTLAIRIALRDNTIETWKAVVVLEKILMDLYREKSFMWEVSASSYRYALWSIEQLKKKSGVVV